MSREASNTNLLHIKTIIVLLLNVQVIYANAQVAVDAETVSDVFTFRLCTVTIYCFDLRVLVRFESIVVIRHFDSLLIGKC